MPRQRFFLCIGSILALSLLACAAPLRAQEQEQSTAAGQKQSATQEKKQDAKSAAKPGSKAGTKADAKPDSKADSKADAKDDPKDLVTYLTIIVTGGKNGKPIDNASVYIRYDDPTFFHPNNRTELDLKTDLKGITKLKDVPRKRIMIQVVKSGWQPFGQYYTLDKDAQTVKINLLPPPNWY